MIFIYLLTGFGMAFCGLFFWTLWTAEDGLAILPRAAAQEFVSPGAEGIGDDPLFEN